ncbi:hypothetical protein O1L55_38740 [Streptomyces albulus]|nr:hypothetical protein [Streptomyces noursei]
MAEFPVVEHLAVAHHHQRALAVEERLAGVVDGDDGVPGGVQGDPVVAEGSRSVPAPVGQGCTERHGHGPVVEGRASFQQDAADAAHGDLLVSP